MFTVTVLEIFGVGFPIDLIPISMRDVRLIMCTDWLSRFGALNDCERQLVVVCTLYGGDLTIYKEGSRVCSTFCLVVKAM